MILACAVCSFVGVAAGWALRWFWREWRVAQRHDRCRLCLGSGIYNARAAEAMRQEITGRFR